LRRLISAWPLWAVRGADIGADPLGHAPATRIAHPIRLFHLPVIPRNINGKVNRDQLKALMLASTGSVSGTARAR